MSSDAPDLCQYGRCGGLGQREVKHRRRAVGWTPVGSQLLRVCESCADLLIKSGQASTFRETAARLPSLTPEQIAQCPDCHGTGWSYPWGEENGVAKCDHNRL